MDVVNVCIQGNWVQLGRTRDVQPTPFSMVLANRLVKQPGARVAVDAGVGGGIQAITLALLGFEQIFAIEISEAACEILEENVRSLGLNDRITIINADILLVSEIKNVDLVVCNPPTIPQARGLPSFVQGAGQDGRAFLRLLVSMLDNWMAPDGEVQLVMSSLVDLVAVASLLKEVSLELRALASFLLPFRRFYYLVWDEESIRSLAEKGRVIVEGVGSEREVSEMLTVYRGLRSSVSAIDVNTVHSPSIRPGPVR